MIEQLELMCNDIRQAETIISFILPYFRELPDEGFNQFEHAKYRDLLCVACNLVSKSNHELAWMLEMVKAAEVEEQ